MRIVKPGEQVFEWVNEHGTSPLVLVCEHASNHVPAHLNFLGLEEADLQRHIAYDIGAAAVARGLAQSLNAPLILQKFSRLIYDCNRAPEHVAAMPQVSEIFTIPGNKGLTAKQKQQRIDEIYRPFHRALEDFLDQRAAQGVATALVSIHSFTRVYHGQRRAVDLGLLFDRDDRMALGFGPGPAGFATRFNEPYNTANGVTHVINLHGYARGLQHLMIEICNDLIETSAGQQAWAGHLTGPLAKLAETIGEANE
jgi:predicted N-formylglutamate amidohydrolase